MDNHRKQNNIIDNEINPDLSALSDIDVITIIKRGLGKLADRPAFLRYLKEQLSFDIKLHYYLLMQVYDSDPMSIKSTN